MSGRISSHGLVGRTFVQPLSLRGEEFTLYQVLRVSRRGAARLLERSATRSALAPTRASAAGALGEKRGESDAGLG